MQLSRLIAISFCAIALALLSATSTDAAILTQTVNFPSQAIISNVTVSTAANTPITATFDKFNPALGTLTAVSFDYVYNFNIAVTFGDSGGNANGVVGGPFNINGTLGGGTGGGGGNGGTPFTVATTPFNGTGTVDILPGDVPNFASSIPGSTNTFTYEVGANLNYTGGSGTGSLNLLNTSAVTINYTYNPVPEPTSLGLLAIGAAATMLRRRR